MILIIYSRKKFYITGPWLDYVNEVFCVVDETASWQNDLAPVGLRLME